MSQNNNAIKLIEAYKLKEAIYNSKTHTFLQQYRQDAIAHLRLLGLPTEKDENYKRCNINQLFNEPIDSAPSDKEQSNTDNNILEELGITPQNKESISLYFVNNHFNRELSTDLNRLPKEVYIGSISDFLQLHPSRESEIAQIYGRLAEPDIDGTVALNQLFVQDLLFINIEKGTHLDLPIVLHHIVAGDGSVLTSPRLMLNIDEGASAQIILLNHHHRAGTIVNRVNEIVVGKGARLEFASLQRESEDSSIISNTILRLHKDSQTICDEFVFSKGVSRNNIRARFIGENAKLILNGMAIGRGQSLIDNFTRVEHTRPECETDELYNYLVDDQAITSFAGRIFISQGAQKTLAYQQNRNILLSQKAKAFSKPQLEIYADDVKCSHGMTTGQLDEDALFYMRQRGIPLDIARDMLSSAFAEKVIDRVEIPFFQETLREEVREALTKA